MAHQTQKARSGSTVRIWADRKERLQKLVAEKGKRERRPVSEAELVSKAVDLLCDREGKKLGITWR